MKTKDRIKEEIGLDKLLMTLSVAIVSSLLSWAWSNREVLSKEMIIFCYFLVFVCMSLSAISFVKIKLKMRELDCYEY